MVERTEAAMERRLGLLSATMIGIGGTIGAGVFVLIGKAAGMAGPGVVFSFIIGALLTLFTAINYSELSAAVPVSGGGYTFTHYAIGKFPSFLTGWFMWCGNMFYCALCAVGFSQALRYFIPSLDVTLPALAVVAVFTAINVRGSEETGGVQNVLTIVLITILTLFIVGGFLYGFKPSNLEPWTPKGILPVFTTVGYIYVCYIGFEVISTCSEEIKDPGKCLPRSIMISFFFSAVLFTLVSLVSVGVIPWNELGHSETPLSLVAERTLGPMGGLLLSVAAILATLTSINASMISSARIAYALARDGYMPGALTRIHERFGTPYVSILFSAFLIALFTTTGVVDLLNYVAEFGFIIGLALINYSVVWLRNRHPEIERPFKVPLYPYVPIFGAVSSFVVLPSLHPEAIGIGLLWVILGLLVYYVTMLGPTRLRIAFGGINIGLGVLSLMLFLLIMEEVVSLPVAPDLYNLTMIALLVFGVLQIVAGIFNIKD
ncbi:amino acid permease [Candidatus Bathyarchaeota archaeon]|nr:amino acid permease [Candidatus Bathyarchaeota archaeon]